MEQITAVFGIDWKLLIAQAVNFGVVLVALRYFLYKPVLKMLDDRKRVVTEGVHKATEAAAKLEKASLERDEIVGGATRDAEGIISSAKEKAVATGSDMVKAAEAKAAAVLAEAAARAEEEKRRALKESEGEIARAAVLMAEKVLNEKHA